jgi:probable F420-dependent oxidoreductase
MKFGIITMETNPARLSEIGRAADTLGFDCIWVTDHLVFPSKVQSRYPYSPDGASPLRTDTPYLDAFSTLSFLSAVTHRVKLGIAVYILPLRNPIVTAKVAATVDVLSGGRLLLGVGAGWMEEEFAIAGEDFSTRGARMDECIAVMKALWTQESGSFDGRFFQFEAARMEPPPLQKPHPPLVVGGESDAALRRAATIGDGWIGMYHNAETVRAPIARLMRYLREAGRADRPFEITVLGGSWVEPDEVQRLAAAGVHRINVFPWRRDSTPTADLERFAEKVAGLVS